MYKVRFNKKYYIITFIFAAMIILMCYGIYFMHTNQILWEDSTPVSNHEKLVFTFILSVIMTIWTISLVVMIRQIFIGYAFFLDSEGIHNTLNATILFALIFVVPVQSIPWSAILCISNEQGILSVCIDKSKVSVFPIFKPFIRKTYHFCQGFSKADYDKIKGVLENRGL